MSDFGRPASPDITAGEKMREKDMRRLKRLKTRHHMDELFSKISSYYFGDEVMSSIRARFPEGGTVVEFGGGESTLELVKHYDVYCVEDNEKYLDLTPEATYIHAPLVQYRDKILEFSPCWYDRDVLGSKLPEEYDFIILDGPETPEAYGRYGAARYKELLNLDVPILIDDLQDPHIYITALMLARAKGLEGFKIQITKENRVYAWIG